MEEVILPACESWVHSKKQFFNKLKALYCKGYRYVVRDKDSGHIHCYSLKPTKYRELEGWGYVDPDGPGVYPAFPIRNSDLLEVSWANRSAVMIEELLRDLN